MFSTASATPTCSPARATSSANCPAYRRCQRNGGCTTTVWQPRVVAAATERRIRPIGSELHTRCVTARQGACMASTGIPNRSASRATPATSWLTGSVQTISSTPSYPSSAASSNATRADSG